MNLVLTAELEELVDTKIRSGLYESAQEVVAKALRLLDEHDRLQAVRYRELKRKVSRGVEQLDRGESAPLNIAAIKAQARLQYRA